MEIRQAAASDVLDVLEIYGQAKSLMSRRGLDQWQDGYPSRETLLEDIRRSWSYVATVDDRVVATFALCPGLEPSYAVIIGEWIQQGSYLSVHRFAVADSSRGTGVADALLRFAVSTASGLKLCSVRSDTHRDNKAMANLLERNGFSRCGVIYLEDRQERIAYECLIK